MTHYLDNVHYSRRDAGRAAGGSHCVLQAARAVLAARGAANTRRAETLKLWKGKVGACGRFRRRIPLIRGLGKRDSAVLRPAPFSPLLPIVRLSVRPSSVLSVLGSRCRSPAPLRSPHRGLNNEQKSEKVSRNFAQILKLERCKGLQIL